MPSLALPSSVRPPWSLATKLLVVGTVFLVLALLSIGLTLRISWHLEGGAAAVNEAGRLRMQSYRLALTLPDTAPEQLRRQADGFEAGLAALRTGDPARPLFVPWDAELHRQFRGIEARWAALRGEWLGAAPPPAALAARQADGFVELVDRFVSTIEARLSRWTTVLHMLQLAMMGLAIASAVALMYAGHLFVLDPVRRLHRGVQRIAQNDFGARVEVPTRDELGELAEGFNRMAEHLGRAYEELEDKVREKTQRLEAKRERLAALYEISSFVSEATGLEALTQGFARRMRRIAGADAVALRWSDAWQERYLMLASDGLPASMVEAEQCLHAARCHCGAPEPDMPVRVIPIAVAAGGGLAPALPHCSQAGYMTLVSVPLRSQHRLVGELDLFYRSEVDPGEDVRAFYETLGQHLAAAMEGLRGAALAREAAVSEERAFIARELHDSIAQSLAFLKMQVPLLRSAAERGDAKAIARVTDDIDEGVRESYGDVRALLLHFRTRADAEDISIALRSTLQKFEHQTGIPTSLMMQGDGLPLDADVQVQVLHMIQESLSNVRKHARASHVWLEVQQSPRWRFTVRDDGCGFDVEASAPDSTHVGLSIMEERAHRIGAEIRIASKPGEGTEVTLTLPVHAQVAAPAQPLPASPVSVS